MSDLILPPTSALTFKKLADEYLSTTIEFPHLRGVTLAQWALECGWGKTSLALLHRNYAGAKWRTYMRPYACEVPYKAHDGTTLYCRFDSDGQFIRGYWARLDLEPAYKGWRDHTATPEDFVNFIGPIWVGTGPKGGREYVRHILQIRKNWFKDV